MNIYLLRHGETAWNTESRFQGQTDIPLNETGKMQVRRTGNYFLSEHIFVDVILTSPLSRARESASIIADILSIPHEKIVIEPRFIERQFGAAEGMTIDQVKAMYPDDNFPGMETVDELSRRAFKALCDNISLYRGQNILITAHGAIIKSILTRLTNGRVPYHGPKYWIENGSFCLITPLDDSDPASTDWCVTLHNSSVNYEGIVL